MEPFKNHFSASLVECIAYHLSIHLGEFDAQAFVDEIVPQLSQLELKQRSQCIADALHRVLPAQPSKRNKVLFAMLHPEAHSEGLPSDKRGIRGWGIMPLTAVVGQYGVADFDGSMSLLKEMTKRFTAEFDVRYFLLADQEKALKILTQWVTDSNHHVRRLVSEGTRPRLPWAMQLPKLIQNPKPVLPLLQALRDDEEEYVRRSVANHLNDISKDHPELVMKLAKNWIRGGGKQREKLLRHGCRSLIKQGDVQALAVFGYEEPKIEIQAFNVLTPEVQLGSVLEFDMVVRSLSSATQALVMDYVVHHVKHNGSLSEKVFKWKNLKLQPGETLTLQRNHSFRKVTTRQYYTGQHRVSLRINGRDYEAEPFYLACS